MKVFTLNSMPPVKIGSFHSKAKMRKALSKDEAENTWYVKPLDKMSGRDDA